MSDSEEDVARLTGLAAEGRLAAVCREIPQDRRLRRAAYVTVFPLVWERHTRPLELRRGHWACARSPGRLTPECHDGFTQDVDAVVEALLGYGRPIGNVPGWVVRRMANAIRDGHRKRRGAIGALQRVRVPLWLARRLGDDPWLTELARLVLLWVGLPTLPVWPLDAWASARAEFTREWQASSAVLRRDLGTVLGAMRTGNPAWHASYVLEPLGHKIPPLADLPDPEPLSLSADPEEAPLHTLAHLALNVIAARLSRGDPPEQTVHTVVTTLFLGPRSSSVDIIAPPGSGLPAVIPNPGTLTAKVLEIIAESEHWGAEPPGGVGEAHKYSRASVSRRRSGRPGH